jgi:2'-5' RNA ligase
VLEFCGSKASNNFIAAGLNMFFSRFFLVLSLLFSGGVMANKIELTLKNDIYQNEFLPFISQQKFDVLAMNVQYEPVLELRKQLENTLSLKLDFFRSFDLQGEAHVTVITPSEFKRLNSKLKMEELEAIAKKYDIQKARLFIQGMGSAKRNIDGKDNETFFVIVDSYELRMIRQQIFYEFTRRGGDRQAFDPSWFFPHITIGFTKKDFHEADGVLKDLKHSYDSRFTIRTIP